MYGKYIFFKFDQFELKYIVFVLVYHILFAVHDTQHNKIKHKTKAVNAKFHHNDARPLITINMFAHFSSF